MAAVHCLTCEHANSAAAKFCESCGSSLNLRLCGKCEAVNDRNAARCHSCAAPLAAPRTMRSRRAVIAVATGAAIAVGAAAGVLYVLDGARLQAAQARQAPAPTAPAAAAPAVPAEDAAPAAEVAPPRPAEPAPKPKAPVARAAAPAVDTALRVRPPAAGSVTHTRGIVAAPPPEPEPERPPQAAQPVVLPIENPVPSVTHTRRAVVPSDTKTGSN